ncbi:MAG: exonuclease SbcCD subunit D [Faecousia sp.]
MGLKILHSADWHMDAPFTSFSEERRALLRREQLKIPGKIAEVCRREHCDLVLLAGDLFDGKPARDAVDAVKKALEECAVPVFVSPGNHDYCQPGSPWLEESWPENVTVFKGDLEAKDLPELHCRIYGAGYRSMDCDPLLDGFRAEKTGAYQIAVIHGDPVTARSPYCPITAAQIRDSGLDYLALGHIHKAGMFRTGDTLCAWPGCPMGRGWDETGDKGICIVTLETEAKVRFMPLDSIRFFELEADLSGGAESALDSLLPAAGCEDFFRITLTGQSDLEADVLQRRYGDFPNLFLRDRTLPKLDLWEDVGSDTFRGTYFRLLQQQAETDSRALLAAELSKMILTGREVKLP